MTNVALSPLAAAVLLLVALARPSLAEVELVKVDVPQDQVWVGQKATFFVQLRGKGPFVGASSFSLPQIPRTVILSVGNPIVSSEDIEDESWFVRTHEFAVFSQVDGDLVVPSFEVRFSNRDGFTGPEQDHVEQVPAIQMQIKRPTGSDPGAFLVTTDSLAVEEKWEPTPGKATQGDVFHRRITQRADQVSGMALAPPPTSVPDGVRVHFEDPEIEDETERGDFTGTRIDRITYVVEEAGQLTLPAVKYVWWKPESEQFGSKTLPIATFEVAAIPAETSTATAGPSRRRWIRWLVVALGLAVLVYWQRRRISGLLSALRETLNPTERRIQRKLLRACRQNDAKAAESAWTEWRTAHPSGDAVAPDLREAVTNLQRQLYGPTDPSAWNGNGLATAFKKMQSTRRERPINSKLPPLNPTSVHG